MKIKGGRHETYKEKTDIGNRALHDTGVKYRNSSLCQENVGLQSVACQAATLERVIKNAEGEDVGTLIADIPEGTFLASSSDANIQMDVQADVGADGVLDRVQQQLEANGETGYTLNNYVMADVTFYVNGEKQIPQQPITFHVSGTSIDTENVMAFADDRQNTTTLDGCRHR